MLNRILTLTLLGSTLCPLFTTTISAPAISTQTSRTTEYTDSNPNNELWAAPEWELDSDGSHRASGPINIPTPQPQRDSLGSTIIGPHNVALELQNADLLAPPTTDHGSVKNFKWPYALSHNRLANGGWARQQNVYDMPSANDIAGVNMRLEAGAIREMHWHATAEWAYVLKVTYGNYNVPSVSTYGRTTM